MASDYRLYSLGWKAFQDLCLSVAQECLKRPVQRFLPSHDGGRDGAFIGTWDDGEGAGFSTIQCKFTSIANSNLVLSHVSDELAKIPELAKQGLAEDYLLLTNHPVSGVSAATIEAAFVAAGATRCRVLGGDWITSQIDESPRLRMLVPRLYGIGDLSNILDERAYEQAKMILSSMGDDIRKLVVTDAHRKSVAALNEHGFVLLLGVPAAGKSTIGASLAVGAADIWGCLTLKPTSPNELRDRINPHEKQFFWVDDAWGATQYQKSDTEAWNRVLPHIASAIKQGSKFLFTSRTYIWEAAKNGLKTSALPLLTKSSVTIQVEKLKADEKAQILYNHIKEGDQSTQFRREIKPFLPAVVESHHFLPESARRLGNAIFTSSLSRSQTGLIQFFGNPSEFLLETIRTLTPENLAALALLFVNAGRVPSPIEASPETALVESAFGVGLASVRSAAKDLNETLLVHAQGQTGPYWRFKHPTIAEAMGRYIAENPELVELYLRGAKVERLMNEVVCANVALAGSLVVVPVSFYDLLVKRFADASKYNLESFLITRADSMFTKKMLVQRPDLIEQKIVFYERVADDLDSDFFARLHEFGLLPDHKRQEFADQMIEAVLDRADGSVVRTDRFLDVLTTSEREQLLLDIQEKVLDRLEEHVVRTREDWQRDNDPDSFFDDLSEDVVALVRLSAPMREKTVKAELAQLVDSHLDHMRDEYRGTETSDAPISTTASSDSPSAAIFRDIDE
ncbi:hypothetical protein [Caballeronia sp. LZ043]|uniref:nSTAND3 domain-containing NTPase n=1 Tax=Caballeronia sp. LZ043 TaxID=3038569 RepID=UPI002859EA70|nr:hypothetical protein [Caballeronia sp. LZ043]MDR5819316.1 hypothetical protein [Caballeronia sp. LZ043]